MPLGESFPQVLAAAKAGADWAWERLFTEVAASLRGYIAAQGVADADNATGEVLLQLVRGLSTFDGDERAFRSWVFLVAHHRVIDDRRRTRRADELVKRMPAVPDGLPADAAMADELETSEWEGRLATLTTEQRTVLLLRVVAGLSADEVGLVIGKKPGAVRVIQHRALTRLRDLLGDRVTP